MADIRHRRAAAQSPDTTSTVSTTGSSSSTTTCHRNTGSNSIPPLHYHHNNNYYQIHEIDYDFDKDDWMTEEEFLMRFRKGTTEFLRNAYGMKRPWHRARTSGILATSLPEDVFTVIQAQTKVLETYCCTCRCNENNKSQEPPHIVWNKGVLSLLHAFEFHQTRLFRQEYWIMNNNSNDMVERYCALANDAVRMKELLAEWMTLLEASSTAQSLATLTEAVRDEIIDVMAACQRGALSYVQQVVHVIYQTLEQSHVPAQLFTWTWENEFVHNELTQTMVKILDDYVQDVCKYLGPSKLLYHHVLSLLVQATVSFYVKHLLLKPQQPGPSRRRSVLRRRPRSEPFANPSRALCRMHYDIKILRSYFDELCINTSLGKNVSQSFSALVVIYECMMTLTMDHNAAGSSSSSLQDFVLVLHKRAGATLQITTYLMHDIWWLASASPAQHADLQDTIQRIVPSLRLLSSRINQQDDTFVLNLKDTIASIYQDRLAREQQASLLLCGACWQPNKAPTSSPMSWWARNKKKKNDIDQHAQQTPSSSPGLFANVFAGAFLS